MTAQYNQKNPKTFLNFSMLLMKAIILYSMMQDGECKEVILMNRLKNKNDIIKMKLFQEICEYVEIDRSISNTQFTCKSVLKNQLTKNYIENVEDLKIQIDYPKSVFMQGPIIPTFTQQQTNKIRKIDQVSDLLKGKCLYYSTFTFLYQYCHKEHIRQFDNYSTFANNAKTEYQDITMGIFDPQSYTPRRQKWDGPPKTPEEKKKTLPLKYDLILKNDHKMMNIQSLHPLLGLVQLEQNQNGQILHSNVHLPLSEIYLTSSPIVLELTCEEYVKSTRKQIRNYALLVTPFDLIYTLKNDKCHKLVSHSSITIDSYHQLQSKLRVYGNYLYGNIEQICTENWNWQKNKQDKQFSSQLLEGNLIILQGFDSQSHMFQRHYITIKKVYNGDLIQVDAALGRSFYLSKQNYQYFSFTTLKSVNTFKNITKCQILSNKRLHIDKMLSNPIFFHNGLIKFPQEQPLIAQAQNIGCFCRYEIGAQQTIIDFDIQLGKTPFDNVYQGYISTKSNIFLWRLFKMNIIASCKKPVCFAAMKDSKYQPKSIQSQRKLRKFTQIVKLSKQNKRLFNFSEAYQQKIYIINIKGKGILKLTTSGQNGQSYIYLISQGQILKIRQFENGTKEIIKQNAYYENMTQIPLEMRKGYIYLKVTKLKNGKYYGGIWKVSDYLYFPRFQLQNEKLLSFEMISGYSYLRILDPKQMIKEQSLAIIHYFKKIEEIYNIKRQSQKKEEDVNHFNQSYKLNYEYVSGKYCDMPVNAFRRTLVTLKCGPSWYSILKIHQKSPCIYYIQIQTKLLCRDGFKHVVQDDQSVLNGLSLSNRVYCHPKMGFYDEVFPYLLSSLKTS